MSSVAWVFVSAMAVALLVLPRRWALLPFIAGACYMTLGQAVDVGPLTFTVIRLLIAVAVVRVVLRKERLAGGMHALDWLMIAWAAWAALSSLFHEPLMSALVFRLGLVYNACGIYFLARIFCESVDDGVRLSRAIAILLVPIALAMLYEHAEHYNVFSVLGGVDGAPQIREGRLRATGPFAHPILAGTVGAASFPLAVGLWSHSSTAACVGIAACLVIVLASASSGPVLSLLFGVGALGMWRYRRFTRTFRWLALGAYMGLMLVMKAPPYYLIARIDVVGGSTGWHRSRLIESALEHLNEWWLVGTDYTRHWMATGLAISPNHTDITNQYLAMGVLGGLPLMLLMIAVLANAFSRVGAVQRAGSPATSREQFVAWTFGSSLVAHAATWVSVSYFDQSVFFFYLVVAAVGSLGAAASRVVPERKHIRRSSAEFGTPRKVPRLKIPVARDFRLKAPGTLAGSTSVRAHAERAPRRRAGVRSGAPDRTTRQELRMLKRPASTQEGT